MYVLLGGVLVLIAGGIWMWWTGARREAKGGPVSQRDVEPEAFDAQTTCVVLLRDNLWESCTFDGLGEDWRKFASKDVAGFSGVPAGRHRIVTACDKGEAALDFVLHPGDVLRRRLDSAHARWLDDEELAPARPDELVRYRIVVGIARAMRGEKVIDPEAAVRDALARARPLLDRARRGEALAALVDEAREIGASLIAVPLTRAQLAALAGAFGTDDAGLAIGRAILPGDPRLEPR